MSTNVGRLRWLIKKASRSAVANGSRLLRQSLLPDRAAREVEVRALTYHRFGDAERDPFCVSAKEFAAQMHAVARAGLAISLAQLQSFIDGKTQLARDAVLVTVDDGCCSLRTIALPILKQYAIPAVAFVSPGLIACKRSQVPAAAEDYLSWSDLRFLAQSGVSIQSHAWSHRSLPSLDAGAALEELVCSKEVLERRLGAVYAFAYPYGTRADFNPQIAVMVGQAGYRLAFTSQHGPIRPGNDRLLLARTKVERGETSATFASLLHGGLDAWRWVDRGLCRIQASQKGQ